MIDKDDIINELKDKDEPDDFIYDFKNKFEPKKDAYAKYVLQEITIKLGSKYSDVQPEDSLTLEHILPQKPDITDWKENDFFNGYTGDETQKKFEKFIYKLGNLTLLKFVINSAIKNKSFDKKKNYVDTDGSEKGYNSSQLEINLKTVMTETEWTAKIIEDRTENFADLAEKIWSLD